MEIRAVKIEDIDNNLLNLYVDGFKLHYDKRKDIFSNKTIDELRNDLIEVINSEDRLITVIEDNNTIVGYASYRINEIKKALWIDAIVIDGNYRNKGYGKILMNKIQEIAENNGCSRVELNCWAFNESALIFYEKLGYLKQRIVFEKEIDLNRDDIDK